MTDQFQLAPYVRLGMFRNELSLGFGSLRRKITDVQQQAVMIEAVHFWLEPHTVQEVHDQLAAETNADAALIDHTIGLLLQSAYVLDVGAYDRRDRYSRHLLFYALSQGNASHVQQRLRQASVTIIGCGGIGNLISVSLATAGVGSMLLVDDDTIELSNLTRQILFAEADIQASKTETLQRELQRRNSTIAVRALRKQLRCEDDFASVPSSDLFIISADSGDVIFVANEHCVAARQPYINVGYVEDIAVWGPLVVPGTTGCFRCQDIVAGVTGLTARHAEQIQAINRQYQPPSIGPVNMVAASHASLDILKYIGGFGTVHTLNRRMGIWTDNLRIESQSCERNPQCRVCGHL